MLLQDSRARGSREPPATTLPPSHLQHVRVEIRGTVYLIILRGLRAGNNSGNPEIRGH